MEKIKPFSELIEIELKNFQLPEKPANLYEPLRYFFSIGGKRIRPLLTLLAADLFGKKAESAIHGAMAVELFHNFSLIHDDIMDEAPLRRKMQTVHEKWNTTIAILSGDVLLIKAYQELCKQDKNQLEELLSIFNQTAVEVCEGQQMDMDFEKRNDVSIEEYIEMIRLKTSVLLGCALKIGAIIADADEKDKNLIYDFGENLGIAFQIQDDLLDLFANHDSFGKQVGGDIISDKKTILTLLAKEIVSHEVYLNYRKQLLNLDNEAKVTFSKEFFGQNVIKSAVVELRNSYFNKAAKSLSNINVTGLKKEKLHEIMEFLKEREI